MNEKLYELFIERERLKADAKNFLDSRKDASGNISQSDADYFEDEYLTETKLLDRQIDRELSKPTRKPILNNPHNSTEEYFGETKNYNTSGGVQGADYSRKFITECRTRFRTAYNTLKESPTESGGYLVPAEFHDEIISQLKEENVLRQIGRVVQTANDREIAIVATAPTAAFVSEGQQINLSTEGFARKTLKSYKLASGVSVSNELLADSYYDVESHLQLEFSKAIGSQEENAFLNGTGSNVPTGLIATLAADSSTTITSSGTAVVSSDDLINLVYSLPRPYRKNACWLMNDTTLAAIRKLKDNTQNYLWERNMALNEPSTLLGFPVYTSEFMPNIASGKIPVIFGDFSKYIIGLRGEMIFKPLYELHALQDLTSYLMIERVDAVLSDKFAMKGLKVG